ncbi:MAG: hypothetical protein ACQEQS_01730 [Thermodesulfobacteriota bacterium]|jgi:hypothetical protein
MLNNNVEHKKVSLDGLNAMKHRDSIQRYQERGWKLSGVAPITSEKRMEYRFKRPKH